MVTADRFGGFERTDKAVVSEKRVGGDEVRCQMETWLWLAGSRRKKGLTKHILPSVTSPVHDKDGFDDRDDACIVNLWLVSTARTILHSLSRTACMVELIQKDESPARFRLSLMVTAQVADLMVSSLELRGGNHIGDDRLE